MEIIRRHYFRSGLRILVSNKQIRRATHFSLKRIPVLLFRCYVSLVVVLHNDCEFCCWVFHSFYRKGRS